MTPEAESTLQKGKVILLPPLKMVVTYLQSFLIHWRLSWHFESLCFFLTQQLPQ